MPEQNHHELRCGVVAIIGRPNVGKSSLLNSIIKEKVAIVSQVPQTTRNPIRGIYHDHRGQIIFVDTPGLHFAKDGLGERMNAVAQGMLSDADCLIHLVDSSEPTGKEEEAVVGSLKNISRPIILGLNKIDLKGKYVDQYLALWEKMAGKPIHQLTTLTLLPLSAKTGFNIDKLISILFEHLPKGPLLYPQDMISDVPQKLAVADIIREKLFWVMREEIPHSLAVVVEEMTDKSKLIVIKANIFVERETQKEIVIGKKGEILKNIGTLAREELEKLLKKKIFLELYVNVKKKWRDNDSFLADSGIF